MALGDEAVDPIQPLLKCITKVATDVVTSFKLTNEMSDTIAELQSSWVELDEATTQLARMTMVVNQLDLALSETSATLSALVALSNEWSRVGNTCNQDAARWARDGYLHLNLGHSR